MQNTKEEGEKMNAWYRAKICKQCEHIAVDNQDNFCVKCGSVDIYRTRACNVFKVVPESVGWFSTKQDSIQYTEYFDENGDRQKTPTVTLRFHGWND